MLWVLLACLNTPILISHFTWKQNKKIIYLSMAALSNTNWAALHRLLNEILLSSTATQCATSGKKVIEQFSLFLQEKRKLQMAERIRGNSNRLYVVRDSFSSCGKAGNKTHDHLKAQTSAETRQPPWRASTGDGLSKGQLPTGKQQPGCFGEGLKTLKRSRYSL